MMMIMKTGIFMLGVLAWAAAHSAAVIEPTASSLAAAIKDRRIVLLGEVHDNGVQHRLRAAALQHLIDAGARPAIAFEQFDRERQSDIDRARLERPRDADYLIEQAGGDRGWRWEFYRPVLQLALDYDLPIVAANLSRRDAFRLTQEGWSAAFDTATIEARGLERLSPDLVSEHERAVARGHCDLLPSQALPPMARAQIARDLTLARAIAPYLSRGVVLLAGNGHVRLDVAVPYWLASTERANVVSIGFLELGTSDATPDDFSRYDGVVLTQAAERPDPCKEVAARFKPVR